MITKIYSTSTGRLNKRICCVQLLLSRHLGQKECLFPSPVHNILTIPSPFSLISVRYNFSDQQRKKIFQQTQHQEDIGTQYTNWILARSQSHNHQIGHLKRKFLKDRFSIHKLTNIKFLCALANHKTEYTLNTNEKIILLAQLNHVFNILGKEKRFYNEFQTLSQEIVEELKDPHDLVCLGTFLATLANVGNYSYSVWLAVMDSLIVKKSDEEYDEIFGIVSALANYRQQILQVTGFHQSKSNMVLQFIPVIFRNHLQLIRQFIKYNIYNLKQCRILFKCLYSLKINEKYFWRSVNDWFNLFIKEQISKKNFDQFFIMNEKAIEKVINDDGMIRPRPILQELTQVAFVIGENICDSRGIIGEKDKQPMRRFLQFVQDVVLYAIENGSGLYVEYLENHQYKVQREKERQQQQQQKIYKDKQKRVNTNNKLDPSQGFSSQQMKLNSEFTFKSQQQLQRLKLMQRSYKTIFINPIQIKNQTIIQLLVIMRKCCGYDNQGNYPEDKQVVFTRPQHMIDVNVLKWLVMRMCKEEMNYTVSELLEVINSQDFLRFAKINLDQFILRKLQSLRSTEVTLKDLRKLMLFLPPSRFSQLSPILTNFLQKSHPSDIYQLTRIIQMQSVSFNDNQYSQQFPRKQQKDKWLAHLQFYFLLLPQRVNNHYKYYSFQENCYFLYYLLKNQVYWEEHLWENNYLGEMEKLKECVKITSYSRGFKLQMNSYFYKLLNYVDLVQFFEGGNV